VQEVRGDAAAEPFYIVAYCADKAYFNDPVVVVTTGTDTDFLEEMNYFTNIRTAENFDVYATIYSGFETDAEFSQFISNSAAAASVSVKTVGSKTFVFSSLTDAVSTYSQMNTNDNFSLHPTEQEFSPFGFDMGTTFDILGTDGQIFMRIQKINLNAGSLSEGVENVEFPTVWYFPIYVSDPAAFNETVLLARCG
jgi:hypothetical protein